MRDRLTAEAYTAFMAGNADYFEPGPILHRLNQFELNRPWADISTAGESRFVFRQTEKLVRREGLGFLGDEGSVSFDFLLHHYKYGHLPRR